MRTKAQPLTGPGREEVISDINSMFTASRLCQMVRFRGSRFWELESKEYNDTYSTASGGLPRFESVADHSWHLADSVLLIAPRFPYLDVGHCVELAVLHDKLEIWCQDISPLGNAASDECQAHNSSAFNHEIARSKHKREREAARYYISTLQGSTQHLQRRLITEILRDATVAARFVRALDKLQVFVFLISRKEGRMEDEHLIFNLEYATRFVNRAPMLFPYLEELAQRLIMTVAKARGISVTCVARSMTDVGPKR